MGLRRHLRKLLRDGERDGAYSTELPWPSMWLFAKLAYVAEQYGYRYGGLDPDFPAGPRPRNPRHIFYRLPDAAARTERVSTEFPRALRLGGRLPGMFRWPVPLIARPAARRDIKLLHARVKVDYFGVVGWERMRGWLIGIPAIIFLAVVVNGALTGPGLLIGAGIALALMLLLACSKVFMRLRHAAYRRLLEREGVRWPPVGGRPAER